MGTRKNPPLESRLGRPTKVEAVKRQEDLLDHALDQFMSLGYRATTMEALVAAIGASKSTIYRRYQSKAGLLRVVMARGVMPLSTPLAAVSTHSRRSPRTVLKEYAKVIRAYHNEPRIRAIWRAVSEAREELGDTLDEIVELRDKAVAPIADYLAALDRDGHLVVANPRAAAACFSEMVSGGLAGFLGNEFDDENDQSLDVILTLFLDGTLPRARAIAGAERGRTESASGRRKHGG